MYYIDSTYLLLNHCGETVRETVGSDDRKRPCKRVPPKAARVAQRWCKIQICFAIIIQNLTKVPIQTQKVGSLYLSFEQFVDRYKVFEKSCDYWKSRATYMKKKKLKHSNFKTSSTDLGKLVDTAGKEKWLNKNSIFYLLIMVVLIGLKNTRVMRNLLKGRKKQQ